jgi:hypothetical protein
MSVEQALIVGGLTCSNAVTMLTCVWLFGRVRHLEGVIEGAARKARKPPEDTTT